MEKEQYKQPFIERVRRAREARGLTQEKLCELLEIPQTTYFTYETDTMMPHWLIYRFCLACGVEVEWLLHDPRNATKKADIAAPAPRPKHTRKSRPRRKPAKIA